MKLIELDNKTAVKDRNDDNYIDPNSLAQILTNFVKLEFIDYEAYNTLEDLFFEKSLLNPEAMNKETLFTIFFAHCSFYKKLFFSYVKANKEEMEGLGSRDNENKARKKEVQNHKFYKGLQ
jgi:hypothetical protein